MSRAICTISNRVQMILQSVLIIAGKLRPIWFELLDMMQSKEIIMGSISRKNQREHPIRKIVAFGDSVTYGISASRPERCWVNRLTRMLEEYQESPIQVINQGLCGNIISRDCGAYEIAAKPVGLERMQQDVIDYRPDLVLIAFGLNDARGGATVEEFAQGYQCMIDQLRKALPDATLVAVNLYYMHESFYTSCEGWTHSSYALTDQFNEVIEQLAEKNELLYADVYAAQKGVDWAVCADHCHPNDLGHLLIANRVFEAIKRNCSLR